MNKDKKVKSITICNYTEKNIYQVIYSEEEIPIEIIQKNGEMAPVDWFKKGNKEYNGKYVLEIEYFEDKVK